MESINSTSPPFAGTVHTLRDAAGQPKKRFTGKLLAHVSTGEHRNLPRWLTLDLYAKPDGTYILHRIGYSVVYHAVGGCEGGERITFADLLEEVEDGEPCVKCRPHPFGAIQVAVENEVSGEVSLEHNYYKVIEVPDVPSLVSELEFVPKNSRTGERVISRPGQELLLRAASHDEVIADIFEAVQDI